MADFAIGNKPASQVSTKQNNPTTATDFGDTGNLPVGTHQFNVALGGSAVAIWEIQHRNAADNANIRAYIVFSAAGQTAQYSLKIAVEDGESVRIRLNTNPAAGDYAAWMQYELQQ